MFTSGSSATFNTFFHLIYPFSISICPFHFYSFCITLLISSCYPPQQLGTVFFCFFLRSCVVFYCLTLSWDLWTFSSIANIFWYISSNFVIELLLPYSGLFIPLGSLYFLSSLEVSVDVAVFFYRPFYPHFPFGFCISDLILLEHTYFITVSLFHHKY